MLLTITTTHRPATDLGYLLHKNPAKVHMGRVFATAISVRSKERQEIADQKIPLTATLAVVACRGGDGLLRGLFDPQVDAPTQMGVFSLG